MTWLEFFEMFNPVPYDNLVPIFGYWHGVIGFAGTFVIVVLALLLMATEGSDFEFLVGMAFMAIIVSFLWVFFWPIFLAIGLPILFLIVVSRIVFYIYVLVPITIDFLKWFMSPERYSK